jgi:hypothetical protein
VDGGRKICAVDDILVRNGGLFATIARVELIKGIKNAEMLDKSRPDVVC